MYFDEGIKMLRMLKKGWKLVYQDSEEDFSLTFDFKTKEINISIESLNNKEKENTSSISTIPTRYVMSDKWSVEPIK